MKQIPYKQIASTIRQWLGRPVVRRGFLFGGSGLLLGGVIMVGLLAFVPSQISFGFQPKTCVDRSVYLWGAHTETRDGMMVSVEGGKLCIQPTTAVAPGTYRASVPLFGVAVLRHTVDIVVPTPPSAMLATSAKVPLSKPLTVALSQPDSLHLYRVIAGEQQGNCTPDGTQLLCDIGALQLTQGEAYDISLERSFKGEDHATVLQQAIEILEPVTVTESSIAPGETVYHRPEELSVMFNKPLARYEMALVAQKGEESVAVPTQPELIEPTRVVVRFDPDALPRESEITLKAINIEATDGSTVEEPAILTFRTSGGPKVQSVNIEAHDVAAGMRIAILFDQEIDTTQAVTDYVTVEGVGGSIELSGKTIFVQLDANAARCVPFTLRASKGLKSAEGIANDTDWQHQSRIRCYETRVIGYSVQGQPITAYYFGSGSQTILYTGAIHGSELSSKYTMESWISELSQRAGDIPADRQVVVVPVMNPDGAARAMRYNANNINLNRNFPTYNWTSNTVVSGGRVEAGAGGSRAASEPETQALIQLTHQLRPRLVVTYHSLGSLVNSNDVGMSISVGQQYSRLVGYQFIPNSQTSVIFGFEMTGTYEDWLLELGIPAILIELPTHTQNFIGTNRSALWMTLRS